MSFLSMMTDLTRATSEFWLRAAQRYVDTTNEAIAATAPGGAGPAFRTDLLAANLVVTAADAVKVWSAVFQFPPAPLLPTVRFTKATGTFVGQQPSKQASLSIPVPPGANVLSSDLGRLGAAGIMPAAQVAVAVATNTELTVTLNLTAEPNPGVYQGIVYQSAPVEIIAHIVVHVTP
jgi:hypothetical protein